MDKLDNIIAGGIGAAILAAFLLGLAESIGALPFWIITVSVLVMCLFDYYEEGFKKRNGNKKP